MFYANSQHFNITNAKETGDIRFVTVGNAVRDEHYGHSIGMILVQQE